MFRPWLQLAVLTALVALGMPFCSCSAGCSADMCNNGSGSDKVYLKPGESITSKNGKVGLFMQDDGNLVIYCLHTSPLLAVWSTETHGKHIVNGAAFQRDGNLVLYDYNGAAVYNTGSYHMGGAQLVIQDDASLVIYTNYGHAVWNSGTAGHCGQTALRLKALVDEELKRANETLAQAYISRV